MRLDGQRVKRTRLFQTDKFVVAVDVATVFPVDEHHAELCDVDG